MPRAFLQEQLRTEHFKPAPTKIFPRQSVAPSSAIAGRLQQLVEKRPLVDWRGAPGGFKNDMWGYGPFTGEAICAISRRRFGGRANNFGETLTGTGSMAPNRRESEPVKFGPQNHYRRFYPRPATIAYTVTWAPTATCSHWSRLEVGSPTGVILAGQCGRPVRNRDRGR